MLRYSIITVIFAVYFGNIQAQSLAELFNGTWVGELTQQPGGIDEKYPFKMTLSVTKDNQIIGRSYAGLYDDPNFANFDFTGTIFKEKMFTFQETKLADATVMEDYTWCIKGGQLILTVEKDLLRLDGFWQGVTAEGRYCIPGKIHLKKLISP